jgi:lipopolysaccharide/colanic/teichoic acid biosynthesis glycosyltransferase
LNTSIALVRQEFAPEAADVQSVPGGDAASRVVIRVLDIVLASALLVFLGPMMLLIAVCTYVADPGPILFAHRRVGYRGQVFACLKFRSMAVNAAERLQDLLERDPVAREEWARDHKLRDDPRIVGIGRFLRKSSLDELPQLFNVLRGEMSLVGPRPIVAEEIERYGRYFARYCGVKPGITGLWQVSGRNDVTYRRRVAIDVKYAAIHSVGLYFKILALTVPMVLISRGSY